MSNNRGQILERRPEGPTQSTGDESRSLGRALFVGLGSWHKLHLSSHFWVLSGQDALQEVFNCAQVENLLDVLDQPTGSCLINEAYALNVGDVHTQYVFSAGGVPAEAVVMRSASGYELLLRSAANRLPTMEHMALLYRNFFSSLHGVAFLDTAGTILDVNRALLDMYALQLRNIVGKTLNVLCAGEDEQGCQELLRSIVGQCSWTGILAHRRGDGRPVSVEVSLSRVRDSNGMRVGYIGQFRDVTSKLEAEQELRRKNAELEQLNRYKSDLMAITSHDVRSPLVTVINAAESIRAQMHEAPRAQVNAALAQIADSTHQVLRLVEDILDLERAESGCLHVERRRTRLDTVLRSSVSRVAAQFPRAKFISRVLGEPEPIVVDAARMDQAITNLVTNAAKLAPDGSSVEATYEGQQRAVRIIIEDRGPGIPPEDLEAIFDRYYRVNRRGQGAERGGVGLGLTIVRHLVQLHGGTVSAENREGGGSRFLVTLPRLPSPDVLSVVIIAASDAHPQRLVDMLARVDASAVVAYDPIDAQRLLAYETPSLVVVFETVLSRSIVRLLKAFRRSGESGMLVCVRQETPVVNQLFDRELVAPIVDVELFEIVRELRLRFKSPGLPGVRGAEG